MLSFCAFFTDVRFFGLAELRKAVSPLRSATALQMRDLAKKQSRNCGELKRIGGMWSAVAEVRYEPATPLCAYEGRIRLTVTGDDYGLRVKSLPTRLQRYARLREQA